MLVLPGSLISEFQSLMVKQNALKGPSLPCWLQGVNYQHHGFGTGIGVSNTLEQSRGLSEVVTHVPTTLLIVAKIYFMHYNMLK